MDDYTHYDFLDLPPGASMARIEAAYQTIKQRLNGHSDEQMIRMIHEAYTILSDAEQRQRYDAELQRIAAPGRRRAREGARCDGSTRQRDCGAASNPGRK